ncbi:MAG: TolB family protein [Bacteroidia bacterium]|nr:TolB family protein [Bacteroidia bacterium]
MKTVLFFLMSNMALSAQTPVGIFQQTKDVGNPAIKGSTTYDAASQTYHLAGGGYNIWFERDEFHYAYNKLEGDFILTANFRFAGKGADAHRKIGWMVRATEDESAAHISGVLHGDGLTALQWRNAHGTPMRDPEDERFAPKANYEILRIERQGTLITFSAAHPGEPLQTIGVHDFKELPLSVLAGLFICSHHDSVKEMADVWNVRISKPKPDDYNAYRQGFIGSRLEVLEVATGMRKVIHESAGRFEAPNWMPDGKTLLYNEAGSLWKIPVSGGTPVKLNTGFADRNNNDHGISFDGKWLAISHHVDGKPGGGSTVYVLPLAGGEPRQITPSTPSYWHGWSADGKDVYYVAQREGEYYDIYKSSVAGGKEVKLTQNIGFHVDGPEADAKGQFIYYNSSASGTMQIWRMKPDGTAAQQLTFDEYNNWFPHISPDGKWMVYISFPPTIDVSDHPFYKRVMLRLQPLDGTAGPRVIAHVYGGQGTMNVPSWSPDGRYIAFVSNSR